MSEQFVPAGYAERAQAPHLSAIAPFAVITVPTTPDWDAISLEIKELDALYDRLAEEDIERRQAEMQFPS